jgi:hypothetical protein
VDTPNSVVCDPSILKTPMVCCADSGWPSKGVCQCFNAGCGVPHGESSCSCDIEQSPTFLGTASSCKGVGKCDDALTVCAVSEIQCLPKTSLVDSCSAVNGG